MKLGVDFAPYSLTQAAINALLDALVAAAGWALVRLDLWGALGTLAAAGRSLLAAVTVGGGVALGVLLAGVQLLPTAELTRESVRFAGLGFDDATSASLWPGMLLTALELVEQRPHANRDEIREHLSGNYCRCTGYQQIVEAVKFATAPQGNADER